MKKEDDTVIRKALPESSLHGTHSDRTSRTGTRTAAPEYPDIGFGP